MIDFKALLNELTLTTVFYALLALCLIFVLLIILVTIKLLIIKALLEVPMIRDLSRQIARKILFTDDDRKMRRKDGDYELKTGRYKSRIVKIENNE